MRRSLAALALCAPMAATAQVGFAAAQIPETWVPVARAQRGEIAQVATRNGHVVWTERELDPATRHHRVQSFEWRLYIAAPGTTEPTLVSGPVRGTRGVRLVIGRNRSLAWYHRSRVLGLFTPGRAEPFEWSRSNEVPLRLYDDAIICRFRDASGNGLSFIPVTEGIPRFEDRTEIARELGYFYDRADTEVLWNGRYVSYTEQADTGSRTLCLYEFKTRALTRKGPGWLLGLDAKYVYCFALPPPANREIFRHSLDSGEVWRLRLPARLVEVLDAAPPRFLVILRLNGECRVALIDTEKLEIVTYDLSRPSHVLYFEHVASLAGDAATGDVLAAVGDTIYRVPPDDERVEWSTAGWEKHEDREPEGS